MQGHDASQGPVKKSSPKRLTLILFIMLSVAALAWLPTLFSRGPPGGAAHTGSDITLIFIPAWLTLTIAVCVISLYFFKTLVDAEKSRDSEEIAGKMPQHH